MNLAGWVSLLPAVASLLGWLVGPGVVCLALVGVRGAALVALAPGTGLAAVGLTAALYGELGVAWGPVSYGLAVVVAAGAAAVAGRVLRARRLPGWVTPYPPLDRGTAWAAVGVVVLAGLLSVLPVVLTGGPELPVQRTDGIFHYNGAWLMLETGNASSLDGLDAMHGLRVSPHVEYPAVWHALVALVATQPDVVAVTNALMVVLPFVWLAGLSALGRATAPDRPWLAVLTPVAASFFPIFPGHMLYGQGFWPNVLGLSALPGVLAATVMAWHVVRHDGAASRRMQAGLVVVLLATALAGMAAAHPSTLFGLGWALLPFVLVVAVRGVGLIRRRLARATGITVALLLALVILGAVAVVVTNDRVVSYVGAGTAAGVAPVGPWLTYLVTLWPPGGGAPMMVVYVILAILTASGLFVAVARTSLRWVAGAWVMLTVLTAAAYVPLGFLTSVTGLWYSSPLRIMAATAPFAVLVVAIGLDRAVGVLVVRAGARRGHPDTHLGPVPTARAVPAGDVENPQGAVVRRLVPLGGFALAVLMVVGVGGASTWGARSDIASATRDPGAVHVNAVADAEEMAMWRRAADRLPDDAVVIGDPANGSAYMQSVGQTAVAFAQVNRRDVDTDGNYLRDHFRQLSDDPLVCEIVQRYGITHFYADEDGPYDEELRSLRAPGLYGVDPTDGLEAVDSGGGATIFRITACGDVDADARDFFDIRWRWDRIPAVVPDT